MKYLFAIIPLVLISCGISNTKKIEELKKKIELLSKDIGEHNIESVQMKKEVEEHRIVIVELSKELLEHEKDFKKMDLSKSLVLKRMILSYCNKAQLWNSMQLYEKENFSSWWCRLCRWRDC